MIGQCRAWTRYAVQIGRTWPRYLLRRNPYCRRSTATRPISYALVGCGDIGYRNAAALVRSENSRLVGVCDTVRRLAEDVARRHGATIYGSYQDALEDPRVEAIVLALPHHLHVGAAVAALEAGKHVVVEKPLARIPEEGQQMLAAEGRTGKRLTVCFPQRYTLASQLARELIQEGAVGQLTAVAITCRLRREVAYWQGGFSGRSLSDWRTQRAQAGGGVLLMNGIHLLDLASWITGQPIHSIRALAHNALPAAKDVEDQVVMQFRVGEGALGSLTGTTTWPLDPIERLDLIGERGCLRVSDALVIRCREAIRAFRPGRAYVVVEWPKLNERTLFFNGLSEALAADRPVPVTSREALAVQQWVAEAYASARMQPLTVDEMSRGELGCRTSERTHEAAAAG